MAILDPTGKSFTPLPIFTTTPAASCPKIQYGYFSTKETLDYFMD